MVPPGAKLYTPPRAYPPTFSPASTPPVRAQLLAALILTSPGLAAAATIFTTQTPASGNVNNSRSIELGVRFRADTAGMITGLRFYKVAGNNGPHTGHLWTNAGALLGSLTFTGETASGWQTASFASPIPISSGTPYVASYHTTLYAATRAYFADEVSNPPLHALQDGVAGPNGLYAYSSGAIFPSQGTRSSNYWVDVVFLSSQSAPPVDDEAPSVSIASPAEGALQAGAVAVTAAAADNVAVTTVQFRLDGADLGAPDLSPPFSAVWNTALSSDGAHVLSAVAWDAAGNASTSTAVSVTVDNTPPLISSVAVTDIGISSAALAWLTDEPATSQVEYGTTTAYGSSTALDSSTVTSHDQVVIGLSSGTLYHYRVRSADSAGNLAVSGDFTFTTTVLPDLTPPSVAISSPAAGAVVGGTVAVVASAFDDVAVATVQFRLDGADLGPPDYSPPFESAWDTAASSDGPHALEAVAWDAAGNASTSAAVSVTVDHTPPSVWISSPAEGSVAAGTVAVVASAFDDVAVAAVQFRLDGADLGPPDAAAPYEIVWNTALSSDGAHGLSAVAWDTAGNASTSAAASVTVDNAPPLISAVAAGSVAITSAAVSWATDEPATSQVEYGTTTAYGSSTALDSSTATSHAQVVIGLSSGTLYHYRVRSTDAAGNLAVSGGRVFTTTVFVGTPTVVSLTFDDGTISHVLARDVLDEKGVKGTFYVNSGRIGGGPAFMNLAQVRSIAAGGHEIGGHTIGHLDLTTLAPEQLEQQICGDRAALIAMGFSPASLAYPFGAFNAAVTATAASCGYASGRGVGGLGCVGCPKAVPIPPPAAFGVATPDSVKNTTTLAAMRQMVTDAEQAGGGWVPVVMHLVCDGCGTLSVSSSTLGAFIDWVKPREALGTVIKTMAQAIGADDVPPSVSISSPAAGALLSGTVAVAAAAFDNVAVATVQFRLDGAALGPPDFSPPFEAVWNTALSSDGAHGLSAVAWDASGFASTSAPVAVSVDNTPPLISSVAVTDLGIDSAALAWLTDEPATSQVEYGTTTAYGSSTALDSSTDTSHARVVTGLSSGTTYHFRVRSADAAGNLGVSGDATFTTAPAGLGCLTSAGDWRNLAFPPQVSSFTVAFDVTPSSAGMNASIGVSTGATGDLAGLAAAVRFNPQGFIDVRYSTSYARMSTVAYSTGTSYRFDLRVNASAHLFDAYVTPQGSSRVLLARNYPFHSSQSTSTVLGNLGLFASPGAATMCNLTVAASTVPWWDGIREVYATAAGSKTWYSTWDNGINRAFVRAVDPIDPWFDAAHGSASFLVDADSGVFKISGNVPRMYIHHPEFVMGSSSLTVANAHAKQWRDVEVTVYGMRVADSNIAWGGINGVARANHGMTGSETVHLCDTRGIGARFRYNGRLDYEKETRHPTTYAINTTTTTLWPSGTAMPFNVWIGFKYAVYDLPNGNVKVESYMDMTNGAAGGTWVLVNQFEDNGANWGGTTACAAGINPQERLTNGAGRPGSESGLPNVSVYFRSDGIGTNGLLYKKMSVREIIAPAAEALPLAAAGAEAQAAEAAGAAPAAAGDEFLFRDLYAFPNPSRRGERVTIRLQAGVADAVDVEIYDLTGRRVNGGSAAGPVPLDDGNGKGPQFTYDYHWNVSGAASAVYLYSVKARKAGHPDIGKTGKVAVIR